MATRREKPAWNAVPRFGGWDQKSGGTPNYSIVFSRARANRKEHKSDIRWASEHKSDRWVSFGNDEELIMPSYDQRHGHKKRTTLMRYFSCCSAPA